MRDDVYHLLLVGVLALAILVSSAFTMLSSSLPNQSAFATFPGENGKIAFSSQRDGDPEIYVMNAGGSEQTRLTNNPAIDDTPDWGPATDTEPEDTIPPLVTVPEDITEEATSPDGAQVSFEVSAEDDVDGPVDVSCDHNSGDTFPNR